MNLSKHAFRSPAAHRSAALLVAAFLLALSGQHADATPSRAGSSGSTESGSTVPARGVALASSSASNSSASSSSNASSSPAPACPDQVSVILGRMSVAGGVVTISFTHDAQNCPVARPALLHVHQNLLTTPQAGSDPEHQSNADFQIGPSHPDFVTVPLLESADGKCFVQVDAHVSGSSRGQFFPTTTCSSSSSSSPAPSSTARTSTPPTPTSSAPSTSQSFESASASRSSGGQSSFSVAQQSSSPPTGSLASTGYRTATPLGLAVALLLAGGVAAEQDSPAAPALRAATRNCQKPGSCQNPGSAMC